MMVILSEDLEYCMNCPVRNETPIHFEIITDNSGNKVVMLVVGKDECWNCDEAYEYLEGLEDDS